MRGRNISLVFVAILYAPVQGSVNAEEKKQKEEVVLIGDVIPKFREKLPTPGAQVGFAYKAWGILCLDMWTYDGEYCIFNDKRYWTITRAEAAELLGLPVNEVNSPFWYRFPPGLCIAVLIGAAYGVTFAVMHAIQIYKGK